MAAAATTAPQHLFALNVGPDSAHEWWLLTKAGADLNGRPSWERGSWKLLYADSGCWELQGLADGPVTSTPTSSVLPFGAGLEWKWAAWPDDKWLVGPLPSGGVLEKALLQAIKACYDEWAVPGPVEELPGRVLVVARASDKTYYWCPVLTKSAEATNGRPTWDSDDDEQWRLCIGASGRWELSADVGGKVQCETLQSDAALPVGANVSWRARAGMHTSEFEVVTVWPWFQADDAQGRLLAAVSRIMEHIVLPMDELLAKVPDAVKLAVQLEIESLSSKVEHMSRQGRKARKDRAALEATKRGLTAKVEELRQQVWKVDEEAHKDKAALQAANQGLSTKVEHMSRQGRKARRDKAAQEATKRGLTAKVEGLRQQVSKQDAEAREDKAALEAVNRGLTAEVEELRQDASSHYATMKATLQNLNSTIRVAQEETAALRESSKDEYRHSILGRLAQCLCGVSLVPLALLPRSPGAQRLLGQEVDKMSTELQQKDEALRESQQQNAQLEAQLIEVNRKAGAMLDLLRHS